jgi:hypothetical protein
MIFHPEKFLCRKTKQNKMQVMGFTTVDWQKKKKR